MILRLIFIFVIQCCLFSSIVLAEDSLDGIDTASVDSADLLNLRNPFLSPLYQPPQPEDNKPKPLVKKKKKRKTVPAEVVHKKPAVDVSLLKLNGMVWGGPLPQAIISGKIISEGETVDGIEVVSINKRGVVVLYRGVRVPLTVDK